MRARPNYDLVERIVLRCIAAGNASTFNQILRNAPVNDRTLQVCLEKLIQSDQIYKIGDKFVSRAERNARNIVPSCECPTCEGRSIVANPEISAKFTQFVEIARRAPPFIQDYNQRPVTFDTAWHRALFALQPNKIPPKRVILLGDDDLTSIPFAMLLPDSEVIVLEADKRIVDFLNIVSEELSHDGFSAIEYDARKKVDDRYLGTADLAVCDPSSTLFELFISRCIDLSAKDGAGNILTFVHPTYFVQDIGLQKLFSDMNLVIRAMIPAFNRYKLHDNDICSNQDIVPINSSDKETISFVESLVMLGVCEDSKPVIVGDLDLNYEELYGETATRRFDKLK